MIDWDASGEQVDGCTADKSTFCENEQEFGFASTLLILLPKRRLVPTGQPGSRFAPEWNFLAPLLCWYLISPRRMNGVSPERVKWFRVASFVHLLPVIVCVFPLPLQIL